MIILSPEETLLSKKIIAFNCVLCSRVVFMAKINIPSADYSPFQHL